MLTPSPHAVSLHEKRGVSTHRTGTVSVISESSEHHREDRPEPSHEMCVLFTQTESVNDLVKALVALVRANTVFAVVVPVRHLIADCGVEVSSVVFPETV